GGSGGSAGGSGSAGSASSADSTGSDGATSSATMLLHDMVLPQKRSWKIVGAITPRSLQDLQVTPVVPDDPARRRRTASSPACDKADDDAVEDVVLARDHGVEPGSLHDHAEDERPASDHVGPTGVHDRDRQSLLAGHAQQVGGHLRHVGITD